MMPASEAAIERLAAMIVDRLGEEGLVFTAGAAADEALDEFLEPGDEALDAALVAARRWRLSPSEEDIVTAAIDEIAGGRGVTCWVPPTDAAIGAALRRGGARRPIESVLQVELALGASSPLDADRAIAARHGVGEPPRPAAVIRSEGGDPAVEIYRDGSALDVGCGAAWAAWTELVRTVPVAWDEVDCDDPILRDEVTRALEEAWPRC
jgi:hypothetical protein